MNSSLIINFLPFRTKRLDGIWEYLHNHEKPSDVYSFVCNAMMNVCNCQNSERYDTSTMVYYNFLLRLQVITIHFVRANQKDRLLIGGSNQ